MLHKRDIRFLKIKMILIVWIYYFEEIQVKGINMIIWFFLDKKKDLCYSFMRKGERSFFYVKICIRRWKF